MKKLMDPLTGQTPDRIDELLVSDHRALEKTFARMMVKFAGGDSDSIRAAWLELDRHLEAHLVAEEKHVLPHFKRHFPAEAARICKEHAEIRAALLQLGIDLDLHALREDTAALFIATLQRHAKSEEPVFYAWAQENLPARERVGVAELLRAAYTALRHRAPTVRHARVAR